MGLRVALIRRLIIYSIQSPRLTICWRYRRGEDSLPKHCQIQKGVHEIGSSSNSGMDEVKVIITLRSGKEIEQPVPMTAEETCKEKEAEPEKIIISEDPVKKNMPPPFPQALRGKKKIPNQAEIWEVLRQVKVNISLLDMIK